MKRISFFMLLLIVIAGLVMGCTNKTTNNENVFVPVQDLVVAEDFDYQTARNVTIDLTVLTNSDEPVAGIPYEIYNAAPDNGGEVIATGQTDANGRYETVISLPTYIKKAYVVGYMTTEVITITDNHIQKVYGGSFPQTKGGASYAPPKGGPWSYLPGYTFNSSGVPAHATAGYVTRDNLSAGFLSRINATLPERVALYNSHPDYFNNDAMADVKLDEACDVWVTFVTEGAGYRNSFGFFTYPQNNPPTSPSQITPQYILMPNTSLTGSAGGMTSGDKVYLGQFPAGIMIGWFIVADGWSGTAGGVSTTKPVYYSIPSLNPEGAANKKKHSILVYDSSEEKLLIGFEDLPRENGSDEDFNDLVVYASANPIEAIDIVDVPPIDTPVDTDGDGVSNTFDDYPTDPELAYDNYTYSQTQWGTLAFEDLWPYKGDYDMNDMVVKYNINQITNGQNKVKKINMRYLLSAVGARKANGFAVEMPFSSSLITDLVTSHPALFNLETGGSKAVLRFFNNTFDLIPQTTGFINTVMDEPFYAPVEFTASFKLSTATLPSAFNHQPPYNPFIFIDGVRGQEVHLPGYTPTTLVNSALFGTGDDATVIGSKYYKTANNLPWAVNIAADWDYPIERSQITRAHLKFQNWAQTSGNSYPDWYLDRPGYRDPAFIYTHE